MELVEDINGDVGFEEGRVWLPTHVLDEAVLEPKDCLWSQRRHPRHGHNSFLPADAVSQHHQYFFSNPSLKVKSRPRSRANLASGGPGMQAIFLESSQKSCGTGFFLPRNTGINCPPSKKPACSPVLLPSRVIEALNLNVYALRSQLTTPRGPKNNVRSGQHQDSNCNKNGSKAADNVKITQTCVPSNAFQSSPEIYLPKDWSY